MTGTGIVPPNSFTLASGDKIRITIDPIGTLENEVACIRAKSYIADSREDDRHRAAYSASRTQRKSDAAGAIVAGRHQQQLAVFVVAIGLRKVPDGTLRLVVLAAAHDGRASMLVGVFIGPLPDVAHHIHHAVRARASGWASTASGPRMERPWSGEGTLAKLPFTAPRISAAVGALRRKLPLPLVRKALAGPFGVGASIFQGNPGDRAIVPACGKLPFFQSRRKLISSCGA